MVERDERLEAELAYQQALNALHEARTEAANVSAAQRRLGYEQIRSPGSSWSEREQELAGRQAELAALIAERRATAVRLRERVRLFAGAEPVDVPSEDPDPEPGRPGFEQPPFGRSGR